MTPLKNEKGFTLIEVMIAIVILGIGITAAGTMVRGTITTNYKNSLFDQANQLLTSFSEETNLASINALPTVIDGHPPSPNKLRELIDSDFDDNTYVAKQPVRGIKLYRVVLSQDRDSSGNIVLKNILLCAAWQSAGYKKPRMLFRTVVKPVASDT